MFDRITGICYAIAIATVAALSLTALPANGIVIL